MYVCMYVCVCVCVSINSVPFQKQSGRQMIEGRRVKVHLASDTGSAPQVGGVLYTAENKHTNKHTNKQGVTLPSMYISISSNK